MADYDWGDWLYRECEDGHIERFREVWCSCCSHVLLRLSVYSFGSWDVEEDYPEHDGVSFNPIAHGDCKTLQHGMRLATMAGKKHLEGLL